MLITLIISGSAVANIFPLMIPCRVILAAFFILPFLNFIIHEHGEILIYFALFWTMFLLSFIINPDNYKYILIVLFNLSIGYAMAKSLDNIKFMKMFLNIMAVMAAVSIVCHCLLNFTPIDLPFTVRNSFNGVGYGVGYIFNYLVYSKWRNCGMFWEPGLMATFMIYSLLIDSIVFKSPNKLRTAIFLIAAILTNSSAGIVILLLYAAFVLFRKYGKEKASKVEIALFLFIIIAGVFAALEYDNIINAVIKFGNSKAQSVAMKLLSDNLSSSQRMSSVIFWWDRFLSSPLAGTGIDSVNADFIWDTATSFMFLGLFGILGATYTVVWIRGIMKLKLNFSSKIILCAIILLIINKEPHSALMFSWFFLFSMLCNGLGIAGNSKESLRDA